MRHVGLVAIGSASGALGRWAISAWWLDRAEGTVSTVPWGTVIANLLGCAAIGWCAATIDRGSATWSFVVTGVLGGLTTTSAFAADTRLLIDAGRAGLAVGNVAISVGGGLFAAASMHRAALARRERHRP